MPKLIIRSDDWDFRMPPEFYIDVHEKFIKAGLIETACLQFTQHDKLVNFKPELINYMNTAPNWDFQLHCWCHDKYSEYVDFNYIVRNLAAAIFFCQKLFNHTPTIWYPPWNETTPDMEKAAEIVGLKIDNESNDIQKFIREVKAGTFKGHSVYFHSWKWQEMESFEEMIKLIKEIESAT